jgi:hypothetical protein
MLADPVLLPGCWRRGISKVEGCGTSSVTTKCEGGTSKLASVGLVISEYMEI